MKKKSKHTDPLPSGIAEKMLEGIRFDERERINDRMTKKKNSDENSCNVRNYLTAFQYDPQLKDAIKYNTLTGQINITKKLWWEDDYPALTDTVENNLYAYLEICYGLKNEKFMEKALWIIAKNNSFNPLIDLLESLEWDGEKRIENILPKYLGAEKSELTTECLKHFMMLALERLYHPGCKAEEMLCLVGGQGAGKSTFFRFLALSDDWFMDDLNKIGDRHVYEKLSGHWIIEMSEMIGAINAKSNEELKSFLSHQKDNYRTPYFKYSEDRPRQCVFGGTTNTKKFIPFDRSGARRFIPVECDASRAEKHILEDEDEAKEYFRQLWAEAMVLYKNKDFSLRFTPEIQKQLDTRREVFMQEDTDAGIIQDWLDHCGLNYVCSLMILKEALGVDAKPTKRQVNDISDIMHNKVTGWNEGPTHRFSDYKTQRSWVRIGTDTSDSGSENVNQHLTEAEKDGFEPFDIEADGLPFF